MSLDARPLSSSALRTSLRWVLASAFVLLAWLAPGQASAQNLCVGTVVFVDANGNGVHDNFEGTQGVRVELWRAVGNDYVLADFKITSSSGFYLFTGIAQGTYYVTIPASEFAIGKPLHNMLSIPGAQITGDDDTGEDGQDSIDPSVSGISTMEFVVEPNFGPVGTQESGFGGTVDDGDDVNGDMTIDFGFYRPVGVGNLVFSDNNSNGRADPGEGVPGVAVQLYHATDDPEVDAPVTDLITDSNGFYLFGGLAPGNYKLHIPAWQFQQGGPLEGAISISGVGQAGDDDNANSIGHSGDDGIDDAQPDLNGITSNVISLQPELAPIFSSGETGAGSGSDDTADDDYNLTVDFGFSFPPDRMGVGNVVYVDFDNSGTYDDGEGMGGVTVELFVQGQNPLSDTPLASRVTRPDGSYLFGSVEAGSYFLYIPRSQFMAGGPLFSALSIVGAGTGDDNTNEDGIDVPYPEISGVRTGDFTLAASAAPTDGSGESGFAFDSDNFRDDRVDLTRDFGFFLRAATPLSVGNLVFNDANANGKVDVGETGIANVSLRLFHEGDNPLSATPVALQQTQSDGSYLFDGLTPGRYFVYIPASQFGVGAALEGFMSSPGNAGDNNVDDDADENGVDSAAPQTTGIASVVFELADNTEPAEAGFNGSSDDADEDNGNLTIDFGFATNCAVLNITPATLPDANKDTAYNQTLSLTGTAETPVWMVSSGDLPDGMSLSAQGLLSGAPTEAGSFSFEVMAEISGGCMATKPYTLEVVPPANLRVGNTIFVDLDHNGHYDDGEGWVGVQVQLFHEGDSTSGPTVQNTTTGANGSYTFSGLAPGRYFVHVPASQFLNGAPLFQTVSVTGWGKDIGVDDDVNEDGIDSTTPATTGISSIIFELAEGAEPTDATGESGRASGDDPVDADGDLTIDLGFMASPDVSVGIGNLVFVDGNNNKVFDAGEEKSGVVVQLFLGSDNPLSASPLRQITTNQEGRYAFMGLDPGSYKVFIPPSQFVPGSPLYGCLSIEGAAPQGAGDDDVDEDGVDSLNPSSTGIVSDVLNLAFDAQPDNSVETGVDGTSDDPADYNTDLTVDFGFVLNCQTMTIAPGSLVTGLVDNPYEAQLTASGGVAPYSFTPAYGLLPPGLMLDASGHLMGTPTVIGDYTFGIQVTDDYGCLSVQPFSLTISSPPLAVGNLVYFDRNANGRADAGEGVDGVTVEVYLASDTPGVAAPIDSATTAGGGRFLIDNLQPDAYILHIPKEMFVEGAPLWAMKSAPGVIGTGDDDSGEDGQDALDPRLTGVTTLAFNLNHNTSPVDTDEAGIDGSSDDARDGDIDLTRDLGFVDATSLPATYADWQAVHSLGGPTANNDNDADSNLLEYALGGDPASGASPVQSGFRVIENPATGEMYAEIRRRHGGQADLAYQVQVLANLAQSPAGWSSISLPPVVVNNGDGTETLTYGPLETDPAFVGKTTGAVRVRVSLDANHDTNPEAQDSTPVQGWQHRSFVTQHQTYAVPFVQPATFTGIVDSVSGTTINAASSAGTTSLAGLLQTGREYYVEVLNGTLEGQRWDVDENNSTATSLVVLPASAHSTRANVPVSLAGSLIALRAHWRVVDLFPVNDFHATLNPSTADTLIFYSTTTPNYTTFWLVNAPTGKKWVRNGDATLLSRNDSVISPMDGVFVRPRVGSVPLGAAGQVRSWDMACPLKLGINFIGNAYPMPMSPSNRLMSAAGGFKASTSSDGADRINIFRGDTSTSLNYTSYYLFSNGAIERWLRVGDATLVDRASEQLFAPATAAFITSVLGHPNWVIPAPWTP